ncbi:thiopeptide-type bacteriocin biosynthesis protein [Bacillus altitudinis]|uniref:thiopeptide-type bacteriocin biosynthesis protein n=1 Tax=Bacillus altitudinis TaxID=293387 RepID=UPI0024817C63|nr:thiopeptide-type bacteriocin biosynthesis protein [Bacillus altitudinis]
MQNNSSAWKAYHVYYHGDLDKLIRESIKPLTVKLLVEKKIEKFFFIRYWEGGPHIRFRIKLVVNNDTNKINEMIINHINMFLNKYPSKNIDNDNMMTRKLNRLANLENISLKNNRIMANNTVTEELYVPEFKKYGGKHGIKLAEEHFFNSSLLIFDFLSELNDNKGKYFMGMKVILSYLKAMDLKIDDCIIFLDNYTDLWSRYMEGNTVTIKRYFYKKYLLQKDILDKYILNSLDEKNNLEFEVNLDWNRHLKDTVSRIQKGLERNDLNLSNKKIKKSDWLEGATYIMTSYIHMTNNRIGLKPYEEAYLSYIINCSIKNLRKEGIYKCNGLHN